MKDEDLMSMSNLHKYDVIRERVRDELVEDLEDLVGEPLSPGLISKMIDVVSKSMTNWREQFDKWLEELENDMVD
jgi:hypothetical protein